MNSSRRVGIIDIGSNSIRLVIYEIQASSAFRVISEFKESARLSGRMSPDGTLPASEIQNIVRMLAHFKQICSAHQVTDIRAAATAAIRNAANSEEIIHMLRKDTGLTVQLLSGEDEARIGFMGMSHTLDVEDGLLIDIGGGSTEVSLFRSRKLLKSVSFPFGAVNTTRQFLQSGEEFTQDQLKGIRGMVEEALKQEPWIMQSPGLPMVGLGGTIRSLSKIHQKKHKYPLPLTHNYNMSKEAINELVAWLPPLPSEKRKKVEGLSKERHDIIVPGLLILHTIFQAAGCTHYVVSGAGLRDGIFYESFYSHSADSLSLVDRSTDNLLALHSTVPPAHSKQVQLLSLALYDALESAGLHSFDKRLRTCLQAAAKLYRIGVSIGYYQYAKHSFYMIAHSRIDGLTHRETLLCALIASFKTKSRLQSMLPPYKGILGKSDPELILRMGMLLQLAIALDASETQSLQLLSARCEGNSLHLHLQTAHNPSAEYREVEALHKEFRKIWGLQLKIHESSFSTN